jgi:hypothetical protein
MQAPRDEIDSRYSRRDFRAIALVSLFPAVAMLGLSILAATDGSNDRHRDFTDFLRGLGMGSTLALVAWAVSVTALTAVALVFFAVQRLLERRTRTGI